MKCARLRCLRPLKRRRNRYCSHQCANQDIAKKPSFKGRGGEVTVAKDFASAVVNEPTLNALVEAAKIDLTTTEITRHLISVWGHPDDQQWQVKAWLAPRRELIDTQAMVDAVVKKALAKIPARPRLVLSRNAAKGDLLLEINFTDLHMGKLAWGRETGFGNYDSKIAEERFVQALETILARTVHLPIAKILLVIGSDMMHSDTKAGTTTKGTPLDNDARYHKTFERLLDMLILTCERCRARAAVEVLPVPGNHDTLATFHLGKALAMFYHKTPDVTVCTEPTMRKYRQWGDVMLMFTHGNQGKLEKYPQIMALERPEMWAATRHREAHTGDKHQEKGMQQLIHEYPGAKVRILPALCPPDAWHSELQFIGKQESAQAFVWSKAEGLIGTFYYTAPPHVTPNTAVAA